MDDLKTRLSKLEKTINNLVDKFKKIEDVKNKKDLYQFSTQQLIKWLKDNQVDFSEKIKDRLIDIVWTNLNEWEWEYYDDEGEEDEEEDEEEEEDNEASESLTDPEESED
jgi:hypothetical protein